MQVQTRNFVRLGWGKGAIESAGGLGDNDKCTNITTEKDQQKFYLFRSKAQMKPKSGLKSSVEETVQRKKNKERLGQLASTGV